MAPISNLTRALAQSKLSQSADDYLASRGTINKPCSDSAPKNSLLHLPNEILLQILEPVVLKKCHSKIDLKKRLDLREVCKHFASLLNNIKTRDKTGWKDNAEISIAQHRQFVVNVANNKINQMTLKGKDLTLANLDNKNFQVRDLSGTIFNRASVKNCNFDQKNLKNTDWNNAACDGSNFNGSDMTGATANKASFIGAKFHGVHCSHADLSESDFSGADLRFSDLSLANIKGIIINKETQLDHTILPPGITRQLLLEQSKGKESPTLDPQSKISGTADARRLRRLRTSSSVEPINIPVNISPISIRNRDIP